MPPATVPFVLTSTTKTAAAASHASAASASYAARMRLNPHLALPLFDHLLRSGADPDPAAYALALASCARGGGRAAAAQLHAHAAKHGARRLPPPRKGDVEEKLSSALINMSSKCGFTEGAVYVFENTGGKMSLDSLNAMLAGFTANSCSERALDLFTRMESKGLVPNKITFNSVLNACSHGDLVEEAIRYFERMSTLYGFEPDIAHHGCMVDLFSRAGMFEEAEEIIQMMPIEPDASMLKVLLGACRTHNNLELGKRAGHRLIEAAPNDHAGYVLLSNIYALDGD
ncbi:unnamed protein product [Urochloa decumbens]|uniref:Pentatricopeptide repeat-containing protein n=1 Tax=Urochloa decumbens TaxID=240449 RepID=A0ABC9FE08_9POAL